MATDTAHDVIFTIVESPAHSPPPLPRRRNYWQLPLFVLGVTAAIAAWRTFPPQPDNPADLFQKDLGALKQAVDRKPVDPGHLVEAARKVDTAFEQFPGEANQANFLLGSAHGFLAESGSDSAEQWSKSARYFAKCDPLTLPDIADRGR